jgi:hypothetical protein
MRAYDMPEDVDTAMAHTCFGILPALVSLEEDKWFWDPDVPYPAAKARVHAFDIEVGVFALILGARAGFSPGELLDFILGWVGIDIAEDDRELIIEEVVDAIKEDP